MFKWENQTENLPDSEGIEITAPPASPKLTDGMLFLRKISLLRFQNIYALIFAFQKKRILQNTKWNLNVITTDNVINITCAFKL